MVLGIARKQIKQKKNDAEHCIKARKRINALKEEPNGNTLGGSKGAHHG